MSGRRAIVRPGVRQAKICDLVTRRGKISVEILASKFETSQETIRRDLSILADAGRIQKIHGGARRAQRQEEGLFDERMSRNALAKQLIAEKIARIVLPRQTIFMDTGSTTLICSQVLARVKGLTVITNSSRIAASFSDGTGRAQVYLLGGRYISDNSQTVGPSTIRDIEQFQTDHAIITVGGLDASGAMDYSNDEAEVARAMIASASQITVVADHSKFGQSATFRVCCLDKINRLVVDKVPERQLTDALSLAEVEVI